MSTILFSSSSYINSRHPSIPVARALPELATVRKSSSLMCIAILFGQRKEGVHNAFGSITTAHGELVELPRKSSCVYIAALMDDLLIASSVSGRLVISETMGKGIRVDKCHGMKKEAHKA